jgi:hypothetical protein
MACSMDGRRPLGSSRAHQRPTSNARSISRATNSPSSRASAASRSVVRRRTMASCINHPTHFMRPGPGRRPVAIWRTTTPKLYTSLALAVQHWVYCTGDDRWRRRRSTVVQAVCQPKVSQLRIQGPVKHPRCWVLCARAGQAARNQRFSRSSPGASRATHRPSQE